MEVTAGPPVLKLYSRAAPVSGEDGFQSALSFNTQRVPGGTVCAKSYNQTRSFAQRPEPAGTAPWQFTLIGSGRRKSPKGTIASENLTVICRT